MAKRHKRAPKRTATRSSAPLQVVRDDLSLHESDSVSGESPGPTVIDLVDRLDDDLELLTVDDAEAMIGVMAQTTLKTLKEVRHRAAAEEALSALFEVFGEGALPNPEDGPVGGPAPKERADVIEHAIALNALLHKVTAYCAARPGPTELGLLRLIQDLGPEQARRTAAQAADELAAAQIIAPRWATEQAELVVERAWRWGAKSGELTAVGFQLEHGHRPQAFSVLIDHSQGGGISNIVLVAGKRAADLREQQAGSMRAEPDAFFEDADPAKALNELAEALTRKPCPATPDDALSIYADLGLVHLRARQLGAGDITLYADAVLRDGPEELQEESEKLPDGPEQPSAILKLKVTLTGSKPPIWRRLEVADQSTLSELHAAIQAAFGWTGSHSPAFEQNKELVDDLLSPLVQLLSTKGDKLVYRYDAWEHQVAVEEALTPSEDASYPRCTGGRRAAPPEDSGDIKGYANLLEILENPDHPEHAQRREHSGPIDAALLDTEAIDQRMQLLQR
ncbi:plasmid pRiA4b ORF-3 family protein [Kineosporia babensis]|uniref:Plasmid pRiA4b ORF-3 family protein n=1 Tax=Kineosporia babensis TaxID=499548 RepID=A0A9X1SRU2_9ACTN|nr:plasmid pRiA4b ORF-3 family protein [Kineosporia babensis]MCD5309551.1 plasmid pRiA4b ORF-3 family protein [Kineosporia babensis]